MDIALFSLVIVAAILFAIINGGHDVSNNIALAVRTRAMTPKAALTLAAVFNLMGALLGTGLAVLFIDQFNLYLPHSEHSLIVLLVATSVAVFWGILTWRRGIPSSSTHALVSALLAGAAVSVLIDAPQSNGDEEGALWQMIVAPLLFSPIVAFVCAYIFVDVMKYFTRKASYSEVGEHSRMGQAVAAGVGTFAHGLQDAQRSTAVIVLALVAMDWITPGHVPFWVMVVSAIAISLGTLLGGWKIAHTLANRLVVVDSMRAMVATTTASSLILIGGIALHMPVSSTHTSVASIVGAGANQAFGSVRWPETLRILGYWLLTPVICALLTAVLVLAISPLENLF